MTWPPTGKGRPGEDGPSEPRREFDTSLTHGADIVPEVEPRAGNVVRVTSARTIIAVCRTCPARFTSTGPAASHARAARHPVDVNYTAVFLFVPAESFDGVK